MATEVLRHVGHLGNAIDFGYERNSGNIENLAIRDWNSHENCISSLHHTFLRLTSYCFFSGTLLQAGVIRVGSQADFSALGTITQNTNWDSYANGFHFPGDPFTVGDLTFVSNVQNLIGGKGTLLNLTRHLLADSQSRGTTATLADNYDMFGFNAGNFGGKGDAMFVVTTNLGSYTFVETIGTATNGGALTFIGWQADPGEHFLSIAWNARNGTGITDIQLGKQGTGTVPEPTSLAIFGLGALGIVAFRRRK